MSGKKQDPAGRLTALFKDYRPARRFSDKPIDPDALQTILESARLAPSANNSQPWRFHIFQKRSSIKDAAKLAGMEDLGTATVLIAAAAEEGIISNRFREQPFMMIDVPIALSHMALQAASLGLGTRLVWDFDAREVSKALDIPSRHKMVALLFLGFPDAYEERAAGPSSDFIRINRF